MNTREQVELDTALTELRGEMASLKGEIVVLKERCAYLESHTGKPAAWQITHHHITGKRDNYLVFKYDDVVELVNSAPSLTRVEIKPVSKEDLAREEEEEG
jgi:hypothetical protein